MKKSSVNKATRTSTSIVCTLKLCEIMRIMLFLNSPSDFCNTNEIFFHICSNNNSCFIVRVAIKIVVFVYF